MATREFLYDRFENYDKPDENDFRVFIDSALLPTTFITANLSVTTDIFTDVNGLPWVLDIRECYVITYGNEKYLLFGLEGTYGLNATTITSSNLVLISTGEIGLIDPITVNANIQGAGISAGEVFPSGTTFEHLFNRLLRITNISKLRYTANDIGGFMEVGSTLTVTKFIWGVEGEPENLYLEDSDGQLGTAVEGTQISLSEAYTYNAYKKLTWTLSGSNVDSITAIAYWVEASYYGTNTTGVAPIEAEVLGGTKVLVLTESFITVSLGTNNNEYGWVAVPAVQTNGLYTDWEVTVNSTSSIGPNEFIKNVTDITVGGKLYNIYIFNWRSEVGNLKLY